MFEENSQLFDFVRKFQQLNIAEKLNLIPQSEMMVMRAILQLSGEGKKYGVTEIAKYLSVSPPAISRTIKKLREKHYVECQTDETDRRNTDIRISEKGRMDLEANAAKVKKLMQNALSQMKKEELEQFYELSMKIYSCMKQEVNRLALEYKNQSSGAGS